MHACKVELFSWKPMSTCVWVSFFSTLNLHKSAVVFSVSSVFLLTNFASRSCTRSTSSQEMATWACQFGTGEEMLAGSLRCSAYTVALLQVKCLHNHLPHACKTWCLSFWLFCHQSLFSTAVTLVKLPTLLQKLVHSQPSDAEQTSEGKCWMR